MTVVENAVVVEEQRIIKKLREQQSCKQKALKSQQTLHKCLNRILRKSSQHQRLDDEILEEVRNKDNSFFK